VSRTRAAALLLAVGVLLSVSACSGGGAGPNPTDAKGIAPLDSTSASPSVVATVGGASPDDVVPTDGFVDVTPDVVPTFEVSAVLHPGAKVGTAVRTTVDVTVEVVGVVPLQIATSVLLLDAAGHEYPDTPDGIGPPADFGTVPIGAKATRSVTIDIPAGVKVTQVEVIGLDRLPIDGPVTYAR
jgi:hypothetical protein